MILTKKKGDPNNKSKPAYKKYYSYCHKNNHSISNCYQKQRDDEYQKYNNQRSRTPEQYFLQYFRSKPNNPQENQKIEITIQILTPQIMIVINIIKITIVIDTETMIDIVAIVENIRKTTIDQTLDKDTIIDPEVRLDLDLIIIIKEELHLDLHIDLHTEITQITDIILTQDTDLVLNHKETPSNDISIHIDLHQDLEILDQDLEHPQETDNKTE